MPSILAARRAAPVATVRLAQLWDRPGPAPDAEHPGERAPGGPPPDEQRPARRWAPMALRGARVAVDARAAAAVVLVALAGVAATAWFVWRGASAVAPVAGALVTTVGTPVTATPPAGGSGGPAVARPVLVVDVAGRVRRPGLVRLASGSRVADALAAAGGVLPGVDLASINLARPLADGEQVLVGVGQAAGSGGPAGTAPGSGASSSQAGPAGLVDLNTATLDQLETLPGVGPVLAQKILDWRTAHGRFSTIDELREVGGIGDRKLSDIAPRARV